MCTRAYSKSATSLTSCPCRAASPRRAKATSTSIFRFSSRAGYMQRKASFETAYFASFSDKHTNRHRMWILLSESMFRNVFPKIGAPCESALLDKMRSDSTHQHPGSAVAACWPHCVLFRCFFLWILIHTYIYMSFVQKELIDSTTKVLKIIRISPVELVSLACIHHACASQCTRPLHMLIDTHRHAFMNRTLSIAHTCLHMHEPTQSNGQMRKYVGVQVLAKQVQNIKKALLMQPAPSHSLPDSSTLQQAVRIAKEETMETDDVSIKTSISMLTPLYKTRLVCLRVPLVVCVPLVLDARNRYFQCICGLMPENTHLLPENTHPRVVKATVCFIVCFATHAPN
jgi:hypothetical protein